MAPIVKTAASFTDYISQDLLVLIPVLMLIGRFVKGLNSVDNRWIPMILGFAGILLAVLNVFSNPLIDGLDDIMRAGFTAIVQGILCSGAAVYFHQLVKNSQKKTQDEKDEPPDEPPDNGGA